MKPIAAAIAGVALAILGVLALSHPSLEAQGTTPASVSKQAALTGIARNVLLPGYTELTARTVDLANAADQLASVPNAASLKKSQQAWVAVLLAWRRTQAFVHGPVTDLDVLGRLQFWPLRPQSIDRVLQARQPIDAVYVEELGANAAGLFPLESLLFDLDRDDAGLLAMFTGPQGERRRKYVQAVAHELERKARLAEQAWQGPSGYAAKFSAGGQDSLNLLVNDLLADIELGAQERLRIVIDLNSVKVLSPGMVEGGLSGSSQQGLLSLLVGAEKAFNGGEGAGLDDYLRRLGSPAAPRMQMQFRKAIAAVRALGGPLDRTTAPQALKQAHEECRALEVLLKVEVASALGVTLTFKSIDGD